MGRPAWQTLAVATLLTDNKTLGLSVLGSDPTGESNLTYTWTASPSTGVTFAPNGTNAAKSSTAALSAAGTYTFTVTVTNTRNLTATSSVTLTVSQTLTGILASPASANLGSHGSQTFTATANDQFGAVMASQPTITWTAASGTISGGQYTAPYASGIDTVTASSGGITSNAAAVTITDTAPTVATPAAAGPSTVTGTTFALSVVGADSDGGGEANLSYTWSYRGPASVTFSMATAAMPPKRYHCHTPARPGAYTFTATITDLGGQA